MANGSTTTAWSLSPLPPQPKLPTYQISRAPDLTLIYDPPVGSQELADALSCHYPFQQGLQQKMLQASIDFLNSEKGEIPPPTPDHVTPVSESTWHSGFPRYEVTTPVMLLDERPDFVASTLNTPWDIKSGKTCVKKPRGRTRGLEASERQRVAKNRGNACERHRKSRTKCHQSLCVDNKLNSCGYHRESNTECTFTCLNNLLVAEGFDMGEDNIAPETSSQSANLPAYYADLELPEQTDSQQLQQFIDPKMISAQQVQDPSVWDYQFPQPLEHDDMPEFGLEPLQESYSNDFINRVSPSLRSRRRIRDCRPSISVSPPRVHCYISFPPPPLVSGHILSRYHREGMLDHLNRPNPFNDVPTLLGQIEQAERRFDGGYIQQGDGDPSAATANCEFGSDSYISPGGNLGGALVASSLLRGCSNQADCHGYYTPLSSGTTTPSARRRSPWCHRERLHHDCASQPSSHAHAIDIVALHGLYQRTWTRTLPSGAKINWPQNLFPTQIPHSRILSYGYNSAVPFSQSAASISAFADSFLERRSAAEDFRPIIFICHSLSGIVVKEALNRTHECTRFQKLREPRTDQRYLDSTKFNSWLHRSSHPLFLRGIPGAGKTRMAAFAIDHLHKTAYSDSCGLAQVIAKAFFRTPHRNTDLARWETFCTASHYDEIRRKGGLKRVYGKSLEERQKQVEELFKRRDLSAAKSLNLACSNFTANTHTSSRAMPAAANADFGVNNPDIVVVNDRDHGYWELFSRNIFSLLYAFIEVWAGQAACCIHLLRLLVFVNTLPERRIIVTDKIPIADHSEAGCECHAAFSVCWNF